MKNNIAKILYEFENNEFNLIKLKSKSNMIMKELKTKKIAIYPAGTNAQLLQETLKNNNLEIEFYLDRAYSELIEINKIKVLNPNNIEKIDSDFYIIISANLDSQFEFFEKIVKNLNPSVTIINGKNLNRLLKSPTCIDKLEGNKLFDLIECEGCGFERKNCPIITKYLKKAAKHKEIQNDFKSKQFDWFGYIVSQTCSLKCEHCCEQVPFLRNNKFNTVERIVKDIKKIAESSKFLTFVELIGGEPFLHPQIELLISELLKIENIGYIKSFTNGTIIPSNKLCEIMQNPRFMLHMSNYELTAKGKLLQNISKTKEKLDSFNIKYIFAKNFEWLDFSSFKEHEASDAYLKNAFKKCFLKNCNRLYEGKLYRCPHHYAGIQRGQLEEFSSECIDIHSKNKIELATSLENFENLDMLSACKHCELAFDAKPVPAGKQLK